MITPEDIERIRGVCDCDECGLAIIAVAELPVIPISMLVGLSAGAFGLSLMSWLERRRAREGF